MSNPTSLPRPAGTARPVVRGRALRYLRLLSLFAGVLALVHPPLLLRRIAHLLPDLLEPFVMLGGMLLAAGGYFVIGLMGHRMRRSPPLRSLASLLMMVPFAASATVVWHGGHPMLLRVCAFLIVFTLVLYLSFIYPLMHTPRPRGDGDGRRYSQPASRAMR